MDGEYLGNDWDECAVLSFNTLRKTANVVMRSEDGRSFDYHNRVPQRFIRVKVTATEKPRQRQRPSRRRGAATVSGSTSAKLRSRRQSKLQEPPVLSLQGGQRALVNPPGQGPMVPVWARSPCDGEGMAQS